MQNEENRGFVSDAVKEQIRQSSDIVDVIGSYFHLKKAAGAYKASCPFHKEKTDSFMVNPQRQIYRCFGCGAGGDVFKFIQQHEGVEFPDAVRMLAERANIKLDFDEQSKRANPLYDVLAEASRLYYDLLRSDEGQMVRDYLESRQITMGTADKFQLGYSPDSWDFLSRSLGKKFEPEVLEQAGLIIKTQREDSRNQFYDRFRGRLMFPYLNSAGKVIAFMGRVIGESHQAKYVNSPETPLFSKGKVLFGMRQAQKAIYDSNQVIVIESNSSALMCNQSGLENVLATSGTAMTEAHRDILMRRFPEAEIIFCFDGDAAGRTAGARTAAIVLGRGNTKICSLPRKICASDPKDPDDIIREKGLDYLKEQLTRSKSTLDFLIEHTAAENNLDLVTPEGLVALLQNLRTPIQNAPPESHGIILDYLSQRLHLRTDAIMQKLLGKQESGGTQRSDATEWHPLHERRREWENNFVKMLLRDGKVATIKYFCEERKAEDLMSEQETKYLLHYLSQQAVNSPLFLARSPLFRQSTCRAMVDEIAAQALKDGVPLNKKYLWYLFMSPIQDLEDKEVMMAQRRFLNERDEDKAKKDIKRTSQPTLEDMEKAFDTIRFKELVSRLGEIPFDLSSSKFESAIADLEKLVDKYKTTK
jgi:DNA primase catalytic core